VRNPKVSKPGKHMPKLHQIGATVTYKIPKNGNCMRHYSENKDIFAATVECELPGKAAILNISNLRVLQTQTCL
jgi:hypothetical protein